MKDNPMISVIMSVYNEQVFIEEAVKSILDQTEHDFELIIVDDCSTDDTVKIIEGLSDERVVLVRNEENAGLTKNLNKALEMTRGRLIARMDGDDISMPDRFSKQTEFLNKHPDIMLISCNTVTFGKQRLVSDIAGSPEELKCTMLLRPVLAHPGFMFRRELYDKYGFKYDEHFRSAQDYDFAARVTRQFKIAVTPEVLLQYRAHKGQVSQTPDLNQFGFADEVRARLLYDLGISLAVPGSALAAGQAVNLESYHKWVLEADAHKDEFIGCIRILKGITEMNMQFVGEKGSGIYDPLILKKTLWYQYFKWVLRSNGKKYIFSICSVFPDRYCSLIKTFIRLVGSKHERKQKLSEGKEK